MRKNLPLLLLISLSFSIHGFGQGKRSLDNMTSVPLPQIPFVELNNTCDSIGWPFSESAGFTLFGIGANAGYLSGTNEYEDRVKANFIDLSSSNANFVLRAIIGLGPVNSKSLGSDLTRQIFVRVYDGTTNTPGAVLGSYVATLEEMRARRLNFTFVVFPSAIQLPPSKKIFLGIEFANLSWGEPNADPAVKDTFAILHTLNGQPEPRAWEQWSDNRWISMSEAWSTQNNPLSINLHLYPLVSADANGCNTLPVTFGGFSGEPVAEGVSLQWFTWTESNSKRFDVERSVDGDKFVTIHSQLSKAINGNHNGMLTYQYTDKQPSGGANFYRIRQVDMDGSFTYSKTIKIAVNQSVEDGIVHQSYPNPVSNQLFVQLAPGIREVETVKFTDVNGRMVGAQKPAVSPDGLMKVNTGSLRSGLNFATIELPDGRRTTIKVIKE